MLTLRALFSWIAIGLMAGVVAGQAVRSAKREAIGHIIVGTIGAVLGGLIFAALGIQRGGIPGSMAVAAVGAVMLLMIIRTIRLA